MKSIASISILVGVLLKAGVSFESILAAENPIPAPRVVSYAPSSQYTVVESNIEYGLTPDEVMDILQPVGTTQHPVVVFIHGGGWQGGEKSPYAKLAEKYASAGYVVANISYRLTRGAQNPGWPAQLEDAQHAIRWLREHASKYKIDPAKFCALGDSAGAHLALLLGSLSATEPGDRAKYESKQSPQVQCVVDNFGPADLTQPEMGGVSAVTRKVTCTGDEKFGAISAENGEEMHLLGINRVFGPKPKPGVIQDKQSLWFTASPVFQVSAHSAPTFIAHGTYDKVVPTSQSVEMVNQFKIKGVPYEEACFDGGHEFIQFPADKREKIVQREFDFIKKYIGTAK